LNFARQFDKFYFSLGASNFVQENNFPCKISSNDLLRNKKSYDLIKEIKINYSALFSLSLFKKNLQNHLSI